MLTRQGFAGRPPEHSFGVCSRASMSASGRGFSRAVVSARARRVLAPEFPFSRTLRPRFLAAVFLLTVLFGAAEALSSQATPDSPAEMTLAQFRNRVEARLTEQSRAASRSREKLPPPDLRIADEAFSQLLAAQAREAAARQSVDRLSGWSTAIQARFQAQSAPALDVEMVRFAEAKATAQSAQYEADRRRALRKANSLLGKPADSALVALLPAPSNASSGALEKLEKEILPQGRELLAKLYQSYLFGGIPLISLLWQEQELYRTELQYRVWLAREAMGSSGTEPER